MVSCSLRPDLPGSRPRRPDPQRTRQPLPAWRKGRRRGLKILRRVTYMWVQIPPPALDLGKIVRGAEGRFSAILLHELDTDWGGVARRGHRWHRSRRRATAGTGTSS